MWKGRGAAHLGRREGRAIAADPLAQLHVRGGEVCEGFEELAWAGKGLEVDAKANLADDVEGIAAEEGVEIDGATGALRLELLLEHRRRLQDYLKVLLHALHGERGQQHARRLVVDGLVVVRREETLAPGPLPDLAVLEEPLLKHVGPLEHLAEQLRVCQNNLGRVEVAEGLVDESGGDLDGKDAAVLAHKPGQVLVHAAVRVAGNVPLGRAGEVVQVAHDGQRRRAAGDGEAIDLRRLLGVRLAR